MRDYTLNVLGTSPFLEPRSRNEAVKHCEVADGFEVFGHLQNFEKAIENIEKLHGETRESKVNVVLGGGKSKKIKLSEFKNVYCREYFQRYSEELLRYYPAILPQKKTNDKQENC